MATVQYLIHVFWLLFFSIFIVFEVFLNKTKLPRVKEFFYIAMMSLILTSSFGIAMC